MTDNDPDLSEFIKKAELSLNQIQTFAMNLQAELKSPDKLASLYATTAIKVLYDFIFVTKEINERAKEILVMTALFDGSKNE